MPELDRSHFISKLADVITPGEIGFRFILTDNICTLPSSDIRQYECNTFARYIYHGKAFKYLTVFACVLAYSLGMSLQAFVRRVFLVSKSIAFHDL